MLLRLALAALVLLLYSDVTSGQCTPQAVNACAQPINDYPIDNSSPIVHLNETVLREHCRRYDLFDICYQKIKPQCNLDVQAMFEGIEQSYQYLCVDTISVYLTFQPCMTKPELLDDGRQCKLTYTNSIITLVNTTSLSDPLRNDRLCSYANIYLDCIYNAVYGICGAKAAAWQRGLDKRALAPTLVANKCQISDQYPDGVATTSAPSGSSSAWAIQPIVIIVAVVLMVMVIIIIIIVLYIVTKLFKRRRNPRRQATDEQMHRDNPAGVYGPVVYPAIGSVSSYEGAVCSGGDAGGKGSNFTRAKDPSPFLFLPPYSGSDAPPPYSNGTLPRTDDSARYNLSANENAGYISDEHPADKNDRYTRSNSYSRSANESERYTQPANDSDRYNMAAAAAVGGTNSWSTERPPMKMPISVSSEKGSEAAAASTVTKMQQLNYAPHAHRLDTSRPPVDDSTINRYLGVAPAAILSNSVQSADSFNRGRASAASDNERFKWSTNQDVRRQPSLTNHRSSDKYSRQPSDSDRYSRATNESERYNRTANENERYNTTTNESNRYNFKNPYANQLAPHTEVGLPSALFKLPQSTNPFTEDIYRTSNSSVAGSVQSSDYYQ